MKKILILLASALLALSTFGCASNGHIDTPILDLGGSASIGH